MSLNIVLAVVSNITCGQFSEVEMYLPEHLGTVQHKHCGESHFVIIDSTRGGHSIWLREKNYFSRWTIVFH
jgi:hypothetical protein